MTEPTQNMKTNAIEFEKMLHRNCQEIIFKAQDNGNDTFFVYKTMPHEKSYMDDKDSNYATCVIVIDGEQVALHENLTRERAFGYCYAQMMIDLIDMDSFNDVHHAMKQY